MARKPVTVSLPSELLQEDRRFCRRRSITMSEVARDAMRDFFFRQRFEEASRHFTAHVRKMGISSEERLIKALQGR